MASEKSRSVYIGGEWRACEDAQPVVNPYSGEPCAACGLADETLVELALQTAARGFEETRTLAAHRRAELLAAIRDGVAARQEEIAKSIALEAGKPIKDSRAEVARALGVLAPSAEEAKRIGGEVIPFDLDAASAGRWGLTRRYPIGPILAITPFNFPLNLGLHKVGPALAAGDSVVWKPSLLTPGAAFLFAEIFDAACRQVGFPVSALSVLATTDDLASSMARDPRIRMLSFTGSDRVGWALRAQAGTARVALEMGGNAAAIVDAGADIEHAARRCAEGGYKYAGQQCNSVQRILVARANYERFVESLLKAVSQISVGDPMEEATVMGPVISAQQANRIMEWLDEAKSAGAKLLAGGGRAGLMIDPTVAVDVPRSVRLWTGEIFGPVVTVTPFDEWTEALELANDTRFGLVAGVFTPNLDHALAAFEALRVGALMVNDVPTYRSDSMPYGGVKDSGLGQEGIRYAIEEMTERRCLAICPPRADRARAT